MATPLRWWDLSLADASTEHKIREPLVHATHGHPVGGGPIIHQFPQIDPQALMHLTLVDMLPFYYLRLYPDLAAVYGPDGFWAGRDHYVNNGRSEGRSPTPFFDPKFYYEYYADIKNAFTPNGVPDYTAITSHWVNYGVNEGRRGSKGFDIGFYLKNHPDLVQAYGSTNYAAAFNHWKSTGYFQSRQTTSDGPAILFWRDNFSFGNKDQQLMYASNNINVDTDTCVLGALLILTQAANGGADDQAKNLIQACRNGAPTTDGHVFDWDDHGAIDKNQYDTDQTERNEDTA